jgi:PEP-CTERM/exosortase A-associated glycosyltransferase
LSALLKVGINVTAVTGPRQGPSTELSEQIDSVTYLRTPEVQSTVPKGIVAQLKTIYLTRKSVASILQGEKPSAIHAHSPCLNGLAAIGHRVPVIYEMRSSWEDAAVSEGVTHEGSIRYRLSHFLETFVVKRVNAIVVICEGLRNELIDRGVKESKICVIPNALPESMLEVPCDENVAKLKDEYRLFNCKTIGFFGSYFQWEGIDLLIRALPLVEKDVPNVKLLLAGGGVQEGALRELTSVLKVDGRVQFIGRVPASQMSGLYRLTDVMAYPRRSNRLTEMVTPLKPLEAMAQGIPVIASDIGGHRELIDDEKTGLLFEAGNVESLAEKLIQVLTGRADTQALTALGRTFVEQERSWNSVSRGYVDLYERVLSG